MAQPRPSEGNGWLVGTNLVLMTSSGRLLTGVVKDRGKLAEALQEVLTSYAQLPEAERRAKTVAGEEKPVPAPPPGGLVLTVYDRPLGRSEAGRFRLPEGRDLGGFRTEAPHGQRSSLWLTEEECTSLIPEDPRPGMTHKVPAKLTKRICLYGMWPHTLWVVEQNWQPNSLRTGELNFTVEKSSPQIIRMRIHGTVLLSALGTLKLYPTGKVLKNLENRYDAHVEGVLAYDRAAKRITQWAMAVLGDYVGCWFTGNEGWKEATADAPLALGFSFELDQSAYQTPHARRRPRSFIHAYLFKDREQFYWDPDKWEEDWKKRQPR